MPDNTDRQPAIFLPHGGGPCFFMDWTWGPADTWKATQHFLESLASTLPAQPKALLVISGHWEEPAFTAGSAAVPQLIYDYSGFPAHTYQLTWPAPGDPVLAARVADLLRDADLPVASDPTRGYDHGVFIPLKVAFPQAQIPVVTLSLNHSLDPALHIAAGRALTPLRDEGVLIVGSGMSFHNLRARSMENVLIPASQQFDDWLGQTVCQNDTQARNAGLVNWSQAPAARYAHPREEHLLPLMVAAGAAGNDVAARTFNDVMMGWRISGFRFG
jgi:aromatic ring-opening dioxygenase catalytic subunit (LigB family)